MCVNHHLGPRPARVVSVQRVHGDFHARFQWVVVVALQADELTVLIRSLHHITITINGCAFFDVILLIGVQCPLARVPVPRAVVSRPRLAGQAAVSGTQGVVCAAPS